MSNELVLKRSSTSRLVHDLPFSGCFLPRRSKCLSGDLPPSKHAHERKLRKSRYAGDLVYACEKLAPVGEEVPNPVFTYWQRLKLSCEIQNFADAPVRNGASRKSFTNEFATRFDLVEELYMLPAKLPINMHQVHDFVGRLCHQH